MTVIFPFIFLIFRVF